MPPKKRGPLQTVQRDTDVIKRKVDALVQQAAQPDASDWTEAFERCKELKLAVEEITKSLKKLSKADEPAPVGNYDQCKRDEEKRLLNLHERLQSLALQLQPQDEVAGPSSSQTEQKSDEENSDEKDESSEDEDTEEEEAHDDYKDDDDADSDDEDTDIGQTATGQETVSYVALSAFTGEEEGDLSIQKGEVLKVLSKNKDGWWLAQNLNGQKGLVPKTFLKSSQKDSERENEDEEESEEEQEESDIKSSKTSNWNTVRKAVTEIDATDVLSAMGAIPPGFRPSNLSRHLEEGTSYRASHFIQPKLSQSQLSFQDLHMDPDTGKVHGRPSRVSLTLTLWSCRMIPPPGVGLQVLSRHVRLCAFNGTQVLSNIHTVRATYNFKSQKTWSFSPRMTGMLPCLLDGDCFLRCDSESPDLGILFELGVTYIRNSTGERGDLSCGWAFLKLFDESGAPITLRTQELTIHGGTPFERDTDMDTTSTKRGNVLSQKYPYSLTCTPFSSVLSSGYPTGVFQQMLLSRKMPKLVVKFKSVNTRSRVLLNLLPDTIVGSLSTVRLLATYRQILADALLLDRVTMCNADLICSSVLASFPDVLDQPDLMDAFRKSWTESESNLRRSDKRDINVLKQMFVSVYMGSVFPLLYSAEMPTPCWADEEVESQRARIIYSPSQKISVETMLSSQCSHQAFDITQVTYDLISRAQH
ncbi:nephrocystin-1 isoform X2 [Rhinichthys klamathensis goyatoka]|uniref:nephrocystin-1 isoform X2 n=1 Tax=Rhinichthys klamathensis goyatoka TaxID=3034132 RepID=UPI0024B5A643|nr:nephrocystin-1 isoform X2 [Rhinichthys klamathensis goyatoka]